MSQYRSGWRSPFLRPSMIWSGPTRSCPKCTPKGSWRATPSSSLLRTPHHMDMFLQIRINLWHMAQPRVEASLRNAMELATSLFHTQWLFVCGKNIDDPGALMLRQSLASLRATESLSLESRSRPTLAVWDWKLFLEYVSIAVPRRPFIPRPPKSESANKAPGVKAKAKAAVKAKAKGAPKATHKDHLT